MSELINNEKIVTDKNVFYLNPYEMQEVVLTDQKYKCKLHSISVNKHFNTLWVDRVEKLNWIIIFKVFNCQVKQLIFYIGYNNEVKNKKVVMNENNCEVEYSLLTQKVRTTKLKP